jgi:hypothetical protein
MGSLIIHVQDVTRRYFTWEDTGGENSSETCLVKGHVHRAGYLIMRRLRWAAHSPLTDASSICKVE